MLDHERFMNEHPDVKEWLKDRPENTQKVFGRAVKLFCEATHTTPEQWRNLDKFQARDQAWKYISTKTVENPSVASNVMAALKSFYRNKSGEALPFDSLRGGKHAFHVRLKKAALEHIPSKVEMYKLIDFARSPRDKAILFVLFQSGVRVNVIQHLRLKDVIGQIDRDVIQLKITPELDHKLRNRDIDFYWTFLNGEGVESLRHYINIAHKPEKRKPEKPLFFTSGAKAISQSYILRIVKNAAENAGLDPHSIWVHTIRKAFRKVLTQSQIDDDTKEQLMGHVLKGSRQAYYDNKDADTIQKLYEQCNFSREIPKSEIQKLVKNEVSQDMKIEALEAELKKTKKTLLTFMEDVVEALGKENVQFRGEKPTEA